VEWHILQFGAVWSGRHCGLLLCGVAHTAVWCCVEWQTLQFGEGKDVSLSCKERRRERRRRRRKRRNKRRRKRRKNKKKKKKKKKKTKMKNK